MRTLWRKHWPKCYTCEFLGKAWRACMKNQASTNLYMYIMLLNIVNAKCWMQEQLDIQLQSLVSYLISSRVGSSQELDLTQLDISDIGSGQTQSNPTCCCLILQKQDASNFWYPITIFFGILSYNKAKDYFVIREPKLHHAGRFYNNIYCFNEKNIGSMDNEVSFILICM